ncbi:MAG: DUF742 domain-containing protein [Catenulispora sp.]|nr:DUF742 domain-containing protein [Catenulispora sp.]
MSGGPPDASSPGRPGSGRATGDPYRGAAEGFDAYRDPPWWPTPYAQRQPDPETRWFDDEAGPVVRLYALTRGRARPVREVFDLLALITIRGRPAPEAGFGPEHTAVLDLCDPAPRSVVDLASDCGLPLGVVRVILSDLLEAGCVRVSSPTALADLPDERILREVINGLRAL